MHLLAPRPPLLHHQQAPHQIGAGGQRPEVHAAQVVAGTPAEGNADAQRLGIHLFDDGGTESDDGNIAPGEQAQCQIGFEALQVHCKLIR
ncbi:hypothetical protein D3C84_783640 [compost metagenome]